MFVGELPDWLHGSLYRNGPGKYEVGEDKYQHWLDPLAMIQCFRIGENLYSLHSFNGVPTQLKLK